jgi:hypothetical protein
LAFLDGVLWVVMPEALFTHNQVKGERAVVLAGLIKTARQGRFFHDRVFCSPIPTPNNLA